MTSVHASTTDAHPPRRPGPRDPTPSPGEPAHLREMQRAQLELAQMDAMLSRAVPPGADSSRTRDTVLRVSASCQHAIGEVLRRPAGVDAATQRHLREADAWLCEAIEDLRAWQGGPVPPAAFQRVTEALAHVRMAIATTINEP